MNQKLTLKLWFWLHGVTRHTWKCSQCKFPVYGGSGCLLDLGYFGINSNYFLKPLKMHQITLYGRCGRKSIVFLLARCCHIGQVLLILYDATVNLRCQIHRSLQVRTVNKLRIYFILKAQMVCRWPSSNTRVESGNCCQNAVETILIQHPNIQQGRCWP